MTIPTQQANARPIGSLHANDYLFAVLVPHGKDEGPVVVPGLGSLRFLTLADYERVISALLETVEAVKRSALDSSLTSR